MHQIAQLTSGYSGSDLAALARDAAYGPIRFSSSIVLFLFLLAYICLEVQVDLLKNSLPLYSIETPFHLRELKIDEVKSLDPVNLRKINMSDFLEAMKRIKK